MTPYQIGFPSESIQKQFEKELARLDRHTVARIKEALDALAHHPRPPGKKFRFLKPPIIVYQYVASYRLRVGNHRILYDIDDAAQKVILLAIRRRAEDTYR